MDLADTGCGEGCWLYALKVVSKSGWSKAVQELLRIFFGNGGCSAVEALQLNAPLRFNQVWAQSKNLTQFNRQEPHGLNRVNVHGFLSLQLSEEPEERREFHVLTRSVNKFDGVQFMSVDEVSPQVVFVAASFNALDDHVDFLGKPC